jgi:hypothetical protein
VEVLTIPKLSTIPLGQAYGMIRVFLASKPLFALGSVCLQTLLTVSPIDDELTDVLSG